MNTLSKTLRLFLDSIGRRSEYEFYLKKFQSDRSVCFALVLPDRDSIRDSGELMAFDLQFLLRLELCPLVLCCGENAQTDADELGKHGPYRQLKELKSSDSNDLWREALDACIREEEIPVLVCGNVDEENALKSLMPKFVSRLHVLRNAGMLQDKEGQDVFYYYTRRPETTPLRESDRSTILLAEKILEDHPGLHISISSPLYLLQEMFTVRGQGSIIRPGSKISHYVSISEVNRENLLQLIQSAFGKELKNPDHLENACDFYIESRYRGAVILESHSAGKYLSKFTVGTEARGEGVAQELWEAACDPQPRLFWRSRSENPVNQWYERHATGHHCEGPWTVFWIGVEVAELPGIIDYCLNRPSDFIE